MSSPLTRAIFCARPPYRELEAEEGVAWETTVDGRPAPSEKGERWLNITSRLLAKTVRAVKADKETQRLQDEFFDRMNQH
jgi:hypothetical protein